VFTKLALKNEVDDLLERFRAFHAGRGGTTLAKLRENFDLLVLKVVSLLQDKDPPLARDISTSRDALWNLLADPAKFKALGFTGGEDERSHAGLGRDSFDPRPGRPTLAGRGGPGGTQGSDGCHRSAGSAVRASRQRHQAG